MPAYYFCLGLGPIIGSRKRKEEVQVAQVRIKQCTLGMTFAFAFLASMPAMAHPGSAIVVDRIGQIWFLDTGDGLWKIATQGRLLGLGGNRFHWMTLDQDDRFGAATLPRDVTRVGKSPTLLIASDYPIAMGRDGNLYYPAVASNGRVQIMRAPPS